MNRSIFQIYKFKSIFYKPLNNFIKIENNIFTYNDKFYYNFINYQLRFSLTFSYVFKELIKNDYNIYVFYTKPTHNIEFNVDDFNFLMSTADKSQNINIIRESQHIDYR